MGRWLAALAGVTVLLVAGCGIDAEEIGSPGAGLTPSSTSTTTGTAPTSSSTTAPSGGTEPSQDQDAAGKLLVAEDLGSDWSGTGSSSIPPVTLCGETSGPDEPQDHAQGVLAHQPTGSVLLQTVGVFADDDQAEAAVASFSADLQVCDNPLIDVQDLDIPSNGDEQVDARLEFTGGAFGSIALVCVRSGRAVTVLTFIDRTDGAGDIETIVERAAEKL